MNKVVLITGASKGIGKCTADYFAKNNYNVIINYLTSKEDALKLKCELENKYNINGLAIKADVSCEEEVRKMVDNVIDKFGHIDTLVNNAGIAIDTTFEDKTLSNFNKILATNLVGTFLVSKYVAKYMKKEGRGSIVNVSSTNGIDSYYPYSMDYDASKAGINILTKNLAVELSPNIRVNAVAPGWVKTEMNKELDKDYIKSEEKKIALGRFADPIEIAKIIYFLASDDASYINGTIVVADGGRK